MKLARFTKDGSTRIGIVCDSGVIDLARHLPSVPTTDMKGLIAAWPAVKDKVELLGTRSADFALEDVTLEAPIARPGKVFAMGLNYRDHCEESGVPPPEVQTWFNKAASSTNGPFDPIELPAVSDQFDYEAEMVVVVGRKCRNVPYDRAHEVIFGYCVGNDVSVRDWQLNNLQWSVGKSFQTATTFGPWITTIDEVDPHNLDVRCHVNGELRQDTNTRHLVFDSFAMIEHLSKAMILEPGDLLYSGTSSGVGIYWKGGTFLKEGDVVRIEIEKLGSIENRVVKGAADIFIE
jgi:2-keto-4-pentenoate hydratase/2-oxohepta-3-ene-1,7-dioic acid hydratase in catechol pathway